MLGNIRILTILNVEHYESDGPKDEYANQRNIGFTAMINRTYGDYSSSANLLLHYDQGSFGLQKAMGFSKMANQRLEYDPYQNAIINFDLLHAWNPGVSRR